MVKSPLFSWVNRMAFFFWPWLQWQTVDIPPEEKCLMFRPESTNPSNAFKLGLNLPSD